MILWVLLTLGCGGSDPELASQRRALDAWRDGQALLEQGRPAEAERRFASALDERPGDPVLGAWRARACAADGRLDDAIAMLDVVLAGAPDFGEARYNRAAYLARSGDVEGAAPDLRFAFEAGIRRTREILEDPDFAPHLGHPALAFLPRQALFATIDGVPDGPVFTGSRVDLRVRVLGTAPGDVDLGGAAASGPARLVGVVEDVVQSTEGPGREWTFSFETLGAGRVDVGPLDLSSGGQRAHIEAFGFEVVAAAGAAPSGPGAPVPLVVPSAAGVAAPPTASWTDGRLEVVFGPTDRYSIDPDPGPPSLVLQQKDGGRIMWTAHRWPTPAAPARVKILRAGKAVFDGPPVTSPPGGP